MRKACGDRLTTKLRPYFIPKVLLPALAVSAVSAAVGEYVLPRFYAAGTGHGKEQVANFVWVGAVFAVSLLMLFMLALLFESVKKVVGKERKARPLGKTLGGLLALLIIFAVAAVIVALLYGLLAVLLNAALKSVMAFDQIKGVINITTMVLTLLMIPVFLNILFTYGLSKIKISVAIGGGLKSLKTQYLKLLIGLAAVIAVGWLGALPFRYMDATPLLRGIKCAVTAIAGMLGMTILLALFDGVVPWTKNQNPVK